MKLALIISLLLFASSSQALDSLSAAKNADTCLFVPYVVSPNAEAGPDYFDVSSSCPLDSFAMSIYDRWGEKVFECHDISDHWYGKKGDVPVPPGTYIYAIRYRPAHRKSSLERTGSVTMIR